MKDRVLRDIGAKGQADDWATIDWKLVKKRVKNLRQRIYRATQNGQWNKVRSLMKLMLRKRHRQSLRLFYSNLLMSVRRVTQENKGSCYTLPQKDEVRLVVPQGFIPPFKNPLVAESQERSQARSGYLHVKPTPTWLGQLLQTRCEQKDVFVCRSPRI